MLFFELSSLTLSRRRCKYSQHLGFEHIDSKDLITTSVDSALSQRPSIDIRTFELQSLGNRHLITPASYRAIRAMDQSLARRLPDELLLFIASQCLGVFTEQEACFRLSRASRLFRTVVEDGMTSGDNKPTTGTTQGRLVSKLEQFKSLKPKICKIMCCDLQCSVPYHRFISFSLLGIDPDNCYHVFFRANTLQRGNYIITTELTLSTSSHVKSSSNSPTSPTSTNQSSSS